MNLWQRMFGHEESTWTVIPTEIEVGEFDQVVLTTSRPISCDEASYIKQAWADGLASRKPVILMGEFEFRVLKGIHKPKADQA
jgi:hypothetical protein